MESWIALRTIPEAVEQFDYRDYPKRRWAAGVAASARLAGYSTEIKLLIGEL